MWLPKLVRLFIRYFITTINKYLFKNSCIVVGIQVDFLKSDHAIVTFMIYLSHKFIFLTVKKVIQYR